MQVILEWLKEKSDEHFQLIIVDAITVLVNLITDSTVDHVSETANKILEMTMGGSDGGGGDGGLQEILHSHLLSLCFFVIDEEINREERFVVDCIFVVIAVDRLMHAQTKTHGLTLPETDMA